MATDSVAIHTNGVKLTDSKAKEVLEYESLLSLRGEIYANAHPRLNVTVQPPKQGMNQANGLSKPSPRMQNGVHKLPSPPMQNASHKLPKKTHAPPSQSKSSYATVSQPVASTYKAPNTQLASSGSASGLSGLDPIFLTKSEVLVRAELHQKRQRIERALDEQLNQNRVIARQRAFDQEALPNFDVTKVLQDAQQIVKPINPVENNGTNRAPSSSDSFDENTFYSSQMNDSTTTDEVDDSATKKRSNRACRYFLDGECRHGDECTFSHDPALKQRVEADGPQAMEIDSVNADEQAPSRSKNVLQPASTNENRNPAIVTQLDHISRLNHIEQLEEQLRSLKSQESVLPHDQPGDSGSAQDEPAYSPPDVGDLVAVRQIGREKIGEPGKGRHRNSGESRAPAILENKSREYARRDHIPRSPLSSDVRVVRNHITSPVAPQPARVSPLALARVPQLHQPQRVFSDSNRPSQGSGGEVASARQSPRVPLGKRRREIDSHDRARNVMPRRDIGSPEIRIKEEPVSPPPLTEPSEVWQPRRRQDVSRPVYVESDSPRYRDQEPVTYQPRIAEKVPQSYLADERRPTTPIARRVISRNGHHSGAHEEQNLRRIVSARQIRVPRSPLEQYAPPQPSSARATSQAYFPQPDHAVPLKPRASVQPQQIISHIDRDQSLSPVPRARFSPTIRGPLTMAPPARRIVIDQYGHRYEAPVSVERQTSAMPIARSSEIIPRYEQLVPRSPSFREPQVVNVYDDRRYVRRAPSPQYVEYHPASTSRHVVDRENEQMFGDEVYLPRNDGIRAVEYSEPRSAGHYEEVVRPREGLIRTQSVRPAAGGLYEEPREQIARIQSVRPEQDRVISLERRREVVPQVSRQISVRADDTFSRPVAYTGAERPKYRYMTEAQEQRYVDEIPDEVVYEAPRSTGRRPAHRL